MPGTWRKGLGLVGLLALAVPAVGPAQSASPSSHSAPADGVSGTVSFPPPAAAAFLERPVPAGNVSGTTSGNRPLAATLDRPVVVTRPALSAPLEQVHFQAAAPSGVPLTPVLGGTKVEVGPMPRTVEPPMSEPVPPPTPGRTVPVPAAPLPPPTVIGEPTMGEVYPGSSHDIWYSEGEPAPCCNGGGPCQGCYAPCCGDGWCGPIRRLLACWDGCCGGPECESPFDHTFYISAEYILWWLQGSQYPVLITQAPPGVLPVPGMPGVFTSLGGSSVNRDEFAGARFRAGMWFDLDHCLGLEGSYFALGDANNGVSISAPTGLPVLAVPLNPAAPFIVTGPGFPGAIQANMRTEFQGADVNIRRNLWLGPQWNVDGLFGFRYVGLRDDFMFTTQTLGGAGASTSDTIRTRNHFYGGQIGAVAETERGCWTFGLRSTSAVGQSTHSVGFTGRRTVGAAAANVGLLTAGANGIDSRSRMAFVQEVGVNVGYRFTECFRATAGYNLLYWSSVARPGEQIGSVIGAPGGAGFRPNETSFWAQGLTLGLEFRY